MTSKDANTLPPSIMDIERHAYYALATLAAQAPKKVSFDESNLARNLESRNIRPDAEIISLHEEEDEEQSNNSDEESEETSKTSSAQVVEEEELEATGAGNAHGILKPNQNDILSGRGAGVNLHPGNVFFRRLIHGNKPNYIKADPGEKKRIIKRIVEMATSHGRFLKQNSKTELWEPISLEEVKKKTGQALRENAPEIKRINKQKADMVRRDMNLVEIASRFDSLTGMAASTASTHLPLQFSRAAQHPQIRNSMNSLGGAPSFAPTTPQTSQSQSNVTSILWSRMNSIQEKQEQLKRKQRELEDEQNQLMQYLYQLTAASSLSPSLQVPRAPTFTPQASSLTKAQQQLLLNSRRTFQKNADDDSEEIYRAVLPKKRRITIVPGH